MVLVRVDGKVFEAGDSRYAFVLGELAAPFTAALVAEQQGPERAVEHGRRGGWHGAGSTGTHTWRTWGEAPRARWTAEGAIVDAEPGAAAARRRRQVARLARQFQQVCRCRNCTSTSASIARDPPIVPRVLDRRARLGVEGRLLDDAEVTADLYLRQSAVPLTAYDLAVMAATLANDGVNPDHREKPR